MPEARFVVPRKRLLDAVRTVTDIIPRRHYKLHLTMVKLSITREAVTLTGTDQEQSVVALVPTTAIEVEPGTVRLAVLVEPARLITVLSKSRAATVTCDVSEDAVELTLDQSCIVIPVDYDQAKMQEYPEIAEPGTPIVSINAADLLRCLEQTQYATDTGSSRYALGGVFFEITADSLTCVATDTRRLSAIGAECQSIAKLSKAVECVVPLKTVKALIKRLPETSLAVFCLDQPDEPTMCWFVMGGLQFGAKLVEGRFPRWRDVIPTSQNFEARFNAEQMVRALTECLPVSTGEYRGCDLTFRDHDIELKTGGAATGWATASCALTGFTKSGPFCGTITFDPRFLLDYLSRVKGDCTLEIRDENSPGVLTADQGAMYIVMPLGRDEPESESAAPEPVEAAEPIVTLPFSASRIVKAVQEAVSHTADMLGTIRNPKANDTCLVRRAELAKYIRNLRNGFGRAILMEKIAHNKRFAS
jgi:DNA polymerase III subunit beta